VPSGQVVAATVVSVPQFTEQVAFAPQVTTHPASHLISQFDVSLQVT
jgi:hypothetical protein